MENKAVAQKKTSSKIPYIRIFFLLFVIGGAIAIYLSNQDNKGKSKVLGKVSKVENPKEEPIFDNLKKQGEQIASETVKNVNDIVDDVLSDATKYISDTASKSAESVKDYVFQNTVSTILKQIDKLPEKQKEEVKREICK